MTIARDRILVLVVGGVLSAITDVADAHREIFTAEERAQLKAADVIHLDALALTNRGAADAQGIRETAAAGLRSLGYTIVRDANEPHDVTVKIKCEEHKTWEGPVVSGGDADRLGAAARLWKGPACQITYRVGNQSSDWRHEVRDDAAIQAADPDHATPAGTVLAGLTARLAEDPFPFLLAGAWDQSGRLLAVLDDARLPPVHRTTVITLLGNMSAVDAIPALTRALKDPDPAIAQSAAHALGAIGDAACIPLLLDQLAQENQQTRLAAIKGLGRLAALHPNSPVVPALLMQLPKEPVSLQIEIVRALGTTTDRRILGPLRTLNRSVQDRTRSDSGPELKELRRVLGQSLDQFDGVHTDE
jgi:hypothetical protein